MISVREASIGIFGAWQLARYDAQGLRHFDNTATACWRSFYAAIIVLPAYVILIALVLGRMQVAVGGVSLLVIESLAYVIGWTAFPVVMYYLARILDLDRSYFRYIAAYNWSAVLRIALFLIVAVAAASGLLPPGPAALINFVAYIAILAYQWFIARVGLEISPAGAGGIVILDVIISLIIEEYTSRLLLGHGMLG